MLMKFSKLPRIYYNKTISDGGIIKIDGEIFHYLKNVLRLKIFREIRLFNQNDGEFKAQITEVNKKKLTIIINDKLRDVEIEKPLTLAISIIKQDKFLQAISASVQLGITKIVPIISERTQFKDINKERITKYIIETVEQTERFTIPKLCDVTTLKDFCNNPISEQIIFANEEEFSEQKITNVQKLKNNIALLIGPEGGFSGDEKIMLKSNPKILSISLGKNVLRSEVATIYLISCINLLQ